MTKKLYDLDSYITSCTATVLSCEPAKKNGFSGYAVALDETCFFPEGGGQPADVGTLCCGEQTAHVLYTYEQNETIYHLCDCALAVGQKAQGQIDFEKRFANMQTHSGEHILSGVIFTELGLHNVGFHMGHEVNTIDLDGELNHAQARKIEEKVNHILYENRPVFVSYPDAETLQKLPLRKKPEVDHLRLVEIQDCDLCGCCGTHVAHTGEVGLLKITDTQRYKGGTRVSFLCGKAALAFCADRCEEIKSVCVALSCKPQEALGNVEKLKAELAEKKQALASKNRQLFSLLAKELTANAEPFGSDKLVFVVDHDLSADDLKAFAMQIAAYPQMVGALFGKQNGVTSYALCRSSDAACDLRALCQSLNKALNGKGGGNQELCCGKLPDCTEEQLRQALACFIQ